VVLSGEADYAGSRMLRSSLQQAEGQHLVVDLSQVTLCDAACITALAFAAKERRERGETFALRDPPRTLLRTLRLLGLTDVFTVEEACLRGAAQPPNHFDVRAGAGDRTAGRGAPHDRHPA
jgi:anti-sigma B factor antagonist